MDCPACKNPMREKNVGEFTVDTCYGGCGGIWFDANELERVSVRAAGSLHRVWQYPQRVTRAVEQRFCPRCPQQPLDRKWFSDAKKVEIDQCPKCNGIWLDDGEFTAIFEVIKKGKAEESPWSAAIAEAVAFLQSAEGKTGEAPGV
jgi:Zn-finger nucleic acid-binding protein